jgi:hypothetical protein
MTLSGRPYEWTLCGWRMWFDTWVINFKQWFVTALERTTFLDPIISKHLTLFLCTLTYKWIFSNKMKVLYV